MESVVARRSDSSSSRSGAVWLAGRGGVICYLLQRGALVVNPRCSACGAEFPSPRRSGERFQAALEVFEAPSPRRGVPWVIRLFVGRKVMVARTALSLAALIDRSICYVGTRVMIAVLAGEGSERVPALFCAQCAETIASHVSVINQRYYASDWLVEFEPRRILPRLYRRLRPLPLQAPVFMALPASSARRELPPAR
jgi:hypothetical protein